MKKFFSFVSIVFIFLLTVSVSFSLAEEKSSNLKIYSDSNEINKVVDMLWDRQREDMSVELKKEDLIQNEKIKIYSIIVKDKKSDSLLIPPAYITQIDNVFILGDIFTVDKDKVNTVTWQKRSDFLTAYQKELEKKIPERYTKIDKTKLIKIGKGSEKNEVVLFASLTCPHCQTALKDIINKKLYKKENIVFYVVLLGNSESLSYILCSSNKEKAIIDILTGKKTIKKAKQCSDVNSILEYYQQLASDFNIRAVPTFIAPKCTVNGYYPGFETKIKECQ